MRYDDRHSGTSMPGQERGAVLMFSLIMLLLLTIIGVTAMQMTTLQERMAGGYRDRHLAFQGAEAALREGEDLLSRATVPDFSSNGADGFYQTGTAPDWSEFDSATTRLYADGDAGNEINDSLEEAPEYFIERLEYRGGVGNTLRPGPLDENDLFRVTARSTGATGQATVVLQVVYKR